MNLENQIVQRICKALPEVKGIYLYGSRATGRHRPDSDYDVAVLAENRLAGRDDFFKLQLEMAALTSEGVNVVDLQSLPTVLQFEVLQARRLLFCSDRPFCIDFQARILSVYQRFMEERRSLEETFIKRRIARVQE